MKIKLLNMNHIGYYLLTLMKYISMKIFVSVLLIFYFYDIYIYIYYIICVYIYIYIIYLRFLFKYIINYYNNIFLFKYIICIMQE